MANTVVLGMQWGDEGKGKIVDLICPAFDAVIRFQGGHNAGHTVKFADRHFALHFLPSGIVRAGMPCVLANGMVIDPEAFFKELARVEAAGIVTDGRLFLSNRAHVILPSHVALDQAREEARGAGKIGTTTRGIGPTYESKAARVGLRLADLAANDLESRLDALLAYQGLSGDSSQLAASCRDWFERLSPYLADSVELLNDWVDQGKSLLFEGAQGAMLDLDHGTFPFVTSSSTTTGGVATGAGVPPTCLDGVLGVLKAYTTRVGSGPFVNELLDAQGELLRQRGQEFGTTTGRPRRCGYFDSVVARHSARVNGVDAIALTKIDVLDTLEEIPICVGYRFRGKIFKTFPAELEVLEGAEPVYEKVKGWAQSTVGARNENELPQAARDYVARLEDEVGVPIVLISTGPKREQTILRDSRELDYLLGERVDVVGGAL